MKAKISKVILWPKRQDKKPRVVKFDITGKVNVITGQSQTGKSSLISIIDYCLGSQKCAIPVGVIRNTVEWFGVVLHLRVAKKQWEILLARRNPQTGTQAGEMFLDEAVSVHIPESVEPNTHRDAVVNRLNHFAELPALNLNGKDEPGFGGKPSFRDTAAFQFQPQHVVANPHTLFFKADTFEHQEKLKQFFPLVLGAVDAATLELKHELRLLENEFNQKLEQLEQRKRANETWLPEVRGFYTQSRAYGLLPRAPDLDMTWPLDTCLGYLKSVPDFVDKHGLPSVERGASSRLAREMASLEKQEESLSRSIADRERKLQKIERLGSSATELNEGLATQTERLEPLRWFSSKIAESHNCPVCGSTSDEAKKEVEHIVELAEDLEGTVGVVRNVSSVLDKEAISVREQLLKLENELDSTRRQIEAVEERSDELKLQRQTRDQIRDFVGRIRQQLQNIAATDDDAALQKFIDDLATRIRALKSDLDRTRIQEREKQALRNISDAIAEYGDLLKVEHPERRVQLDLRNLTLNIESPTGGFNSLWEIGSGANWMAYHVATLLALHQHFLSVKHNPVPQFLVFDQPSQAFFPERMPSRTRPKNEAMHSDDIARVNLIFRTLSKAAQNTGGRVQLIILDHADEITWRGVANIHLVERWRGGNALVPPDWME